MGFKGAARDGAHDLTPSVERGERAQGNHKDSPQEFTARFHRKVLPQGVLPQGFSPQPQCVNARCTINKDGEFTRNEEPEMKSQDNNYMPEVVPHVSRSYGKVFIFKLQWLQTATGKLPSDSQEHSRKVASINDKSDNCAKILWNHGYWTHQR